jgi:hypothetical protein
VRNILFAKLEVWLVLLLALLGLLGLVVFGAAVLDGERETRRFGPAGAAALAIAEIPDTVKALAAGDTAMQAFQPGRFADMAAGWTFAPDAALTGYVLLSHYDGDRRRHVVQLVSLADGAVKHEWLPDADSLLAGASRESHLIEPTLWNTRHYRAIHPYLTSSGELLIKDHQSYLYALSPCGEKLWEQTGILFHHSTESDGAGGFWIPGYVDPSEIDKAAPDFVDDALVHVGPRGEILSRKSVTQILLDHGMEHDVFGAGRYQKDPVHLNDIEPVLEDGTYWKKGDLFLSFRHLSMIMLYRPSTDEVLWYQQGPWLAQHDVDILDDHRIGVFNNDAYDKGTGARVYGVNEITVHDFTTGIDSDPWKAAFEGADIRTLFEGLFDLLPGDVAMIEDENSGRLIFARPDGAVVATFVNKSADGTSYRMGWSRYMSQADGDAALTQLGGACDGE